MSSILARADRDELIAVVDHLLTTNADLRVTAIRSPEVGTVQLQVREPVCEERFIIADGLATVAEVMVSEALGWAMRLGDDPEAATAAAVADALVAMNSPVDGLWRLFEFASATELFINSARNAQLRRLLDTAISFEELD
jgi:phosphonate C-P lyase system protein PhnG